jgi:HK97 family phage major capsid protein
MPREVMTSDTVKYAKELYHPNVYWGGEIDEYTRASNAEFGDVTLTVKNQSASVVIPNNKIYEALQNGVALEETTIANLVNKLTSSAEYNILYGPGTNSTPLGIFSKMSSGNKTTSAGNTIANINDDIQTLMNFIEGANVQMNLPTSMFISAARTKNQLAWKTTSLGIREYAEVNTGTLAGIPFRASNYIPTNTGTGVQTHLWLIDWSKFILGIHNDIQITIDSTGAYRDSAGVVQSAQDMDVTIIRAKLKFDFGMWYDKAAALLTALNYNN